MFKTHLHGYIAGSGKIQQKIPESSNYYIAVGNLHSEEVEVIVQMFTASCIATKLFYF